MAHTTRPRTITALKEWALICDLLIQGRMSVLFRKGGIGEKGFWVEADEFALFPTYFHQNRDNVRAEFLSDFDAAMAASPLDGTLRIPALARVVDAIEVRRPDRIGELEDLHPYAREQVDMRLEFRPRKPLVLLVVQAFPLREAIETPARAEYGGCSSWVPLDIGGAAIQDADLAAAALPIETVRGLAARVRDTVG